MVLRIWCFPVFGSLATLRQESQFRLTRHVVRSWSGLPSEWVRQVAHQYTSCWGHPLGTGEQWGERRCGYIWSKGVQRTPHGLQVDAHYCLGCFWQGFWFELQGFSCSKDKFVPSSILQWTLNDPRGKIVHNLTSIFSVIFGPPQISIRKVWWSLNFIYCTNL